MSKKIYKFIKTNDNSIGLYDEKVGDILHSKTGALKEANEKFIKPLENIILNDEINVLDICYGVGYNTKAVLNKYKRIKINIDALESDINLIYLSPLLEDNINDDELKNFIIEKICNISSEDINTEYLFSTLIDSDNKKFLSSLGLKIIPQFDIEGYKSKGAVHNNRFLHNIYYNYISNNMINNSKPNKYNNSDLSFYLDDARKSIMTLNKLYDVVFLDAYSPKIDPVLWTIDFLNEVKKRMNNNSILVSYSKSVPFRSALVELGFCVGKTLIDNIDMGTVASFNSNIIINKLSDYDMNLISTRSGITFKDPDLNLFPSEILNNRKIESDSSCRISRSSFMKNLTR